MSNPNRSFYVREITRKVEEQINSVRRELANLLSIGVITSDTSNNRLYYEVNQKFAQFEALSMMFGDTPSIKKLPKKKAGSDDTVSDTLEAEIRSLGNVQLALLTGQFTRDEQSGIDILLVGDLNKTKVENFVADLEQTEKKDIRFVVFTEADFRYRQQINDRFTVNVLESKIQAIIDRDGLLVEEK